MRVVVPCYRCNTRQTDPARGASPWGRAVIGGEQVLVCPTCQSATDWRAAVDRCAGCGSSHLAKALGLVVCRDCGARSDQARPATIGPGAARPTTNGQASVGPTRGGRATDGSGEAGPDAADPATGAARGAPREQRTKPVVADASTEFPPVGAIPAPTSAADPDRPGSGAEDAATPVAEPAPSGRSDLAADVEAALARMFGRGPAAKAGVDRPTQAADDR